jgi:transposase
MQLRDTLGSIYPDEQFADLLPTHGQPAEAPWRLALVTIFQFMEHLTDRQAADAVRSRLDWKYALSLELTDPGFDHTVLSEFRSRLIQGTAELRLLDLLLERCRESGWLDPAAGAGCFQYRGLDENAACRHHPAHHLGSAV